MTRLAAGDLTLQPQTVFPLADAAGVHARLESGELRGKALLEIGSAGASRAYAMSASA
jgi:hypothetical protein